MSAPAAGISRRRAARFYDSTVGKKIVMAVSGVVLFGYVVAHLLGNLQIFIGPDQINHYAALLHASPPLLWTARIFLLIMLFLHIWSSVQLALRKWDARPIAYVKKRAVGSSYASRTMYWSGPIVLAFLIFHLLQFTAGIIHPGSQFIEGDVYHNVVAGFQVWWVSAWYIFAVSLLGVHLSHGISAMFQSLGLAHPRYTPLLNKAAVVIATAIVLGFISVPISVLLEVVK